jgi:hypothetical protein
MKCGIPSIADLAGFWIVVDVDTVRSVAQQYRP